MNEKISVIVPVYNVENYLGRCVDSLLKQTYRDLEIILVDDGSTDRSGGICDEYAQKDGRIRVLHKENGGLSDARNAGMQLAKGGFLAFVDSDDLVAPGMYERMLNVLRTETSDVVQCGVIKFSLEEELTQQEEKPAVIRTFTAQEALRELTLDRALSQTVWNKLYTREAAGGILFEKGKLNEDEFWTYQVFGRAQKVSLTEEPFYFYYQRPGSIMQSGYSLRRLDALEAKELRQRYFEKNYPALCSVAKVNLVFSCIYAYQMCQSFLGTKERKIAKKKICDIIKRNPLVKKDKQALAQKERVWTGLLHISLSLTAKIRNILSIGV